MSDKATAEILLAFAFITNIAWIFIAERYHKRIEEYKDYIKRLRSSK